MAAKNKKAVLPCYIHGANSVLKKNSRLIAPGNIILSIGPLITYAYDKEDHVKVSSKFLQETAEKAVRDMQKKHVDATEKSSTL